MGFRLYYNCYAFEITLQRNMKLKLVLKETVSEQVDEICNLINLAYRGNSGWTKETDLVSGNRAEFQEVTEYISNQKSHLLVASEAGNVKACICVEENENRGYIGFFAVHPDYQGRGKNILLQAERLASEKLGVRKYVMVVVSQREELISFYERRGYARTGNIEKYPTHPSVGIPLNSALTIEYLEKDA